MGIEDPADMRARQLHLGEVKRARARRGIPTADGNIMRKIAAIALLSFPLAACEPAGSGIFLPMEPTQASIDARRRELTEAEKEAISDAVKLKLQDPAPRDFRWAKLILRSRNHVTDYCGLVSELDFGERHATFRRFYAQLGFDGFGKLLSVDVISIEPIPSHPLPSSSDSICVQGGYNISP